MQDLFGNADYFPELKEVLIAENVSVSSELNDVLVHKMDLLPKLDLLCVNVRKNNEVQFTYMKELFDRSKELMRKLLEK